jgi:hypothetical protein
MHEETQRKKQGKTEDKDMRNERNIDRNNK